MSSLNKQKFVNYIYNKDGERISTNRTKSALAIGDPVFVDGLIRIVIEVEKVVSVLKNVSYNKVTVEVVR